MYKNIDRLLRQLNPLHKQIILDILKKLDNDEFITSKDFTQSEWVPKTFLLATYNREHKNQELMNQAISKFKVDENGCVHFPIVIGEFIRLSIERDRPLTLFDLCEE